MKGKNKKGIIGVIIAVAVIIVGIVWYQKAHAPINPLKNATTASLTENNSFGTSSSASFQLSDNESEDVIGNVMTAVAKAKYPKAEKLVPQLKSLKLDSLNSSGDILGNLGNSLSGYGSLVKELGAKDAASFMADVSEIMSSLKIEKDGDNKAKAYFALSNAKAKEFNISTKSKELTIK